MNPQERQHRPGLTVGRDMHGIRLEDFLRRRWPELDWAFLRRLVLDGRVLVGGEVGALGGRLLAGDRIQVQLPSEAELPTHAQPESGIEEIPILYEDSEILVVDKPAGMHSVPDRAGKYPGVQGRLLELRPGEDLRMVHRLDRDTSGCLILAKGLEVSRHLDSAYRARQVAKEYLALASGVVSFTRKTAQFPLGPDKRRPGRIRVVSAGSKGARSASTELERLEVFRNHSLLRLRPRTGRSHQIRVHLAHLGHPIVADRDYGTAPCLLLSEIKRGYKGRRGVPERPLLRRMFLHAESVVVPGLGGGDPIAVSAPLPRDLEIVLQKLRSFAAPRKQ